MKTLTMMIALLTVTTAAMAESSYIPRQGEAARAEVSNAQQQHAVAVDSDKSISSRDTRNTYTHR
jgi:hypothetical protein